MRQWYQPHLEQRYPDAVVRAGDLDQLQRIACGLSPRASDFLTDLTLDPPSATSDEAGAPLLDEDYLILSTIHSAKGQEWRCVYVLNVVDGCIPSDMSTGNSGGYRGGAAAALRRHDACQGPAHAADPAALLRASAGTPRRQASLRVAHALHSSGASPGRFEARSWPPPRGASGAGASKSATAVDLGARMRQMWRGTGT